MELETLQTSTLDSQFVFLIFIGIYTKQKERKYGVISEKKKKRELKPPIVS